MFVELKQLEIAAAGRFRIITEVTEIGLEIFCLDQNDNLLVYKRLSALQLKNPTLRIAVLNDL